MSDLPRRDTQADEPSLASDPDEIARLEVRNGFAQAYEGGQVAMAAILSVRAGYVPSGSPSIPAQIEADRTPYFHALEQADQAYAAGDLDLTAMEALLASLLARQLLNFFENARGNPPE